MYKKDPVRLHNDCKYYDPLFSRCTRRKLIVIVDELACSEYVQRIRRIV